MRSISPHPRTDGLVHISLLQHYHQTHLAGTNILKDIEESRRLRKEKIWNEMLVN